jgi:CarboxypepD_reg-like domain/TonB-dependent Receptor Plug Domain
MRKLYIISAILLKFVSQAICQTHTVSGYVTDKETRETLIGVSITIKETKQGVVTDNNGYFSVLNLKAGDYTFLFSYLGYQKLEKIIHVQDNSVLLAETQLMLDAVKLRDVTIVGARSDSIGDRGFETSQLKMSANTIRNIPSAHGDIFKAIKYLPGIEATDPFSPLYSVRGGDPSGNLVLLDGVTVYNPYHLATADGLFNTQSVKDIDLFVGGFGAEYGGRNSSILYITTKDGNMNKLHGEIEPTTTHTKVFLEFPVGKNGSMMVAGRYFYNLPMRFILGGNSYFYDANISYTNRLNDKNRLTIKLFDSQDNSNINIDRELSYIDKAFETDIYKDMHLSSINRWSNRIATAYLKTIINPNIYLKTQVYGSFHTADINSAMDFRYKYDSINPPIQITNSSKFASKINDVCAKSALTIKTDAINTFNLGFELNKYYFSNDAEIQHISNGVSIRQPSLFSCFAEDKMHFGNLTVRPGLRLSRYSYYNKWEYEPRLNLSLDLPANFKLKAAWGIYYQYIISMNTQEYEISQFLDYYYPLKNNAPTKSVHYIAGIEKPIGSNSVLSANAYYIDMPLTYMFNLNLDQLQASTFSDKLEKGTGKSYGIEIMWKGQYKKLSGWMSYGLSRTTRSYPFIMDGKSFLFDYDRTHSFKAVVSYKITDDITYNTSLVAQSGVPKTLETTLQSYFYYNPISGSLSSYPFGVENGKNNARLPMSIDLDFGVTKRIRSGFGADLAEFLKADRSYLTVSIGNILFLHRNVIWYFPYGGKKYIPIGSNYLPTVTVGYVIKF